MWVPLEGMRRRLWTALEMQRNTGINSELDYFFSVINLCWGRAFFLFMIFCKKAQDPQMGFSIPPSPRVHSLQYHICVWLRKQWGSSNFPWKIVSQSNCLLCFAFPLVVSLRSTWLNFVSSVWFSSALLRLFPFAKQHFLLEAFLGFFLVFVFFASKNHGERKSAHLWSVIWLSESCSFWSSFTLLSILLMSSFLSLCLFSFYLLRKVKKGNFWLIYVQAHCKYWAQIPQNHQMAIFFLDFKLPSYGIKLFCFPFSLGSHSEGWMIWF